MKKFLLVGILALVLIIALSFVILMKPSIVGLASLEDVITQQVNETIYNDTSVKAEFGDLVSINFILTLDNGTVADANNEELAKKHNFRTYIKGPFKFILGQSGKIPGFDEAVVGMQEGERKEKVIEPSEEEIILKLDKQQVMKRFVTIPRLQAFPRTRYESLFGKPPVIGDVVKTENIPFTYQIVNMTNKSVIGKMLLKKDEKYRLSNTEWDSKVIVVAEQDAMFAQIPEENQTIETPFGIAKVTTEGSRLYVNHEPQLNKIFNRSIEIGPGFSMPILFRVIEVGNESFTIKRYGALTDKYLGFDIEMLSIIKNVKQVRKNKQIITETVGGN